MPTNLLLLPLLGGYWFLHVLHYTRFRSQRLDGYRLLLESAIVGVVLSIVSRILVFLFDLLPYIRIAWRSVAPDVPFLGTASGALLLGVALPYGFNAILSKTGVFDQKQAQFQAIQRHGNHILRLVHTPAREERPVLLTLDNRKFYVGMIVDAPNLESHDAFLSLLPWLSGYRDAATLTLRFTVDYQKVYEKQSLDPYIFRVVVPISNIRMISFFDQKVYPAFVMETRQDLNDDGADHPGTSAQPVTPRQV